MIKIRLNCIAVPGPCEVIQVRDTMTGYIDSERYPAVLSPSLKESRTTQGLPNLKHHFFQKVCLTGSEEA